MKPLRPCTSRASPNPPPICPEIEQQEEEEEEEEEERNGKRKRKRTRKKGGIVLSRTKRIFKDFASDSSSSSSSITMATASSKKNPRRNDENALRDLALPLGMSFAAIVSQVLDGTNKARNQIPIDRLSLICTLAVKESVVNIYGDRFDYFLLNFEKSFGSTLRTLRLSSEGFRSKPIQKPANEEGKSTVIESSTFKLGNVICSSSMGGSSCEPLGSAVENFEEIQSLTALNNNQIVLRRQMDHELTTSSQNFSMLSTFEKSVIEQTRSNDLKEYELNLIKRKLHLKESQLALSSYANMLDKIKISMGVSKAFFREEKLRNQMLDARHAELVRRCIDLLVAGLIIMSGCLGYGACTYSYQRITEATSSCSATPKESKSWWGFAWVPKPWASFNSGLLVLQCHAVALTRMLFGLFMILAIAYSVFQRSAMSTPTTMPVTFILLMLGFACGVAGKLCVDTLGGSGLHWLLYWEVFCLVHFFASIFPAAMYRLLYGPLSVSHMKGRGSLIIPYWFRRSMFYLIVSTVYPVVSGLLPFASMGDWKEHFAGKLNIWMIGVQN